MTAPRPLSEFQLSETAALYQGRDEIPVSFFITAYPEPAQGPGFDVHPYAEVFYVHEGQATFTVDTEQVVADAKSVVVVGPETPHGFKTSGDGTLRVFSIHPSPEAVQTWLE